MGLTNFFCCLTGTCLLGFDKTDLTGWTFGFAAVLASFPAPFLPVTLTAVLPGVPLVLGAVEGFFSVGFAAGFGTAAALPGAEVVAFAAAFGAGAGVFELAEAFEVAPEAADVGAEAGFFFSAGFAP